MDLSSFLLGVTTGILFCYVVNAVRAGEGR
jgi:hypothetical protein